MAHRIDMTNNRANIAFLGDRADIWHKLGQPMQPGMSIQEWAKAAGLDWQAIMVSAFASLPSGEMREVEGHKFMTRSDNGEPLGYVSDGYQPVQPSEVLKWFRDYITVDDRFQLDVAGSLKEGRLIWATATFNGEMDVAGDKHRARVLMTTTFDGSGSTINQATMTRVVCNNTLKVATTDKRAVIRSRHSSTFKASQVAKELADIAQSFESYKTMGEALARSYMSKNDISNYFKKLLDIPFDAKEADVSGRKLNQFRDLNTAYSDTVREGTQANTAWTALNAVTRYVDHDRSVQGTSRYGSEDVARFLSANFGSGDNLKTRAVELVAPYQGNRDGVAIPASFAAKLFA